MNTELDRSLDRIIRGEEHRARAAGFGATKQGQALARKYLGQLTARIAADRAFGRDKDVWRALREIDNETLAVRLLVAGIGATTALGWDSDDVMNYRDQALSIGRTLGHRRELGFRIGAHGIDALSTLDAFTVDDDGVLRLTTSAYDFMDETLERALRQNALLYPLTVPPEKWTQVQTGGLPADHWAKEPLIRSHHRSIDAAVRKAISTGKMQRVLDAINSLQAVPFCINEPVLDFIRAREVDSESSETCRAVETDLAVADAMIVAGRFWVPLNIDFRGRVYGIPHFNFAREDHVRALFLFADGERIGEDGLQWLKAHVAATAKSNSWSPEEKPDRFGFKERIAWTDANISTLRRVGEAVLRGESPTAVAWALPKDRYQFAAACAELVQALDTGPDFITRLPVTFDGTCSGLQHLCAMTRAEEGRFVNLTAQEEAQDFYSLVAVAVWKRRPDLVDDPLDRELVKQPAMSYFYGSEAGGFSDSTGRWRPHGMTRQIYDVLKDRKQPTTGAQPLAETVCGVIGDMVPRAKALRDYLKDLADMCAKEGKHLRWDTPLGLPVINCYHQPDEKRVSVYLNGKRRQVKLVVGDKDKISRRKAANAAAANFVHSIDAAHLQLVALAAGKENIELAVVHDCFGCLAPRAKRLNEIIRQQFIELHKPNNFLAAIYSSARKLLPQRSKPPLPPEVGTLEIERVLDSFHAWK